MLLRAMRAPLPKTISRSRDQRDHSGYTLPTDQPPTGRTPYAACHCHHCDCGRACALVHLALQRDRPEGQPLRQRLADHRRPAAAQERPHTQPGRDREGLRRARVQDARGRDAGAFRRHERHHARGQDGGLQHPERHPEVAVCRGRGVPRPQGKHQLPAAAGRALRDGEQDRLRAPELQRLCAGVQQRNRDLPRQHRGRLQVQDAPGLRGDGRLRAPGAAGQVLSPKSQRQSRRAKVAKSFPQGEKSEPSWPFFSPFFARGLCTLHSACTAVAETCPFACTIRTVFMVRPRAGTSAVYEKGL